MSAVNDRHDGIFLWDWARKRRRGFGAVLLIGAGVGAAGGVVFALLMLYGMTANGGAFGINEDATGPILGAIGRALGPAGFLFFLSIPAFAGLGAFIASVVWRRMEFRYHYLLEHGARVPPERPVMTAQDRMAKWAVLGGFALLCLFLFGMVIWEINRGGL